MALMSPTQKAAAATLKLAPTVSSRYDDNLFRVSKAARANIVNPADVANTIALIGGVETTSAPISLSIQGATQRTLFVKNSTLDYTEYSLLGTALYKAGDGQFSLTASQIRRASSFEDLRVGPKSIQTLRLARIDGNKMLASRISLLGQATLSSSETSSSAVSRGDNRRLEITGGIGYVSPTGNMIAVEGRRLLARGLRDRLVTIGGLPVAYRANFNEESANLRVEWQMPLLWSVSARIGYARHHDLSGITSDFEGVIGKGRLSWSPTPFITLSVAGDRSFSADETPFANGVKITTYNAGLRLQPADRVQVEAGYSRRERLFRYDLQATDPVAAARLERLSTLSLSGGYSLASRLQATLAIEHRRRQSNIASVVYQGTATTLTLSMPLTR